MSFSFIERNKNYIQYLTVVIAYFKSGVCDMMIFDGGRLKCLHDLLLEKYHSIVLTLQRTFYQLQFCSPPYQ